LVKGSVVARVFRRGDLPSWPAEFPASEEAGYKIGKQNRRAEWNLEV
jgi:hypothetical protein